VLDHLSPIPAVRYRFKEGTGRSTDPQIRLIAQDVQAAFPELVTRGSDGHLSLAYPKLTAVLLQGLQDQQNQIETLEQRLAALEHGALRNTPAPVLGGLPIGAWTAGLVLLGGLVFWRRRATSPSSV